MAASAEWHRQWQAKRRAQAIAYLGDRCVDCGSTDGLQFDHADATTKSFDVGKNLNRRWDVIQPELDKCVLRCGPCHLRKTLEAGENPGGQNKWQTIQHGKAWAYGKYGCRCDLCRAAAAAMKRRGAPVRKFVARNTETHGTPTMYGYHKCRCDVCKEGQRLRAAKWRASKITPT